MERPGAKPFVPAGVGLDELREAIQACRGCELWEPATQAVFGRGTTGARVVLVGEQPGDEEDRRGLPFVGPAGHLLVKALDEAGVDRSTVYVTNVVKHFRFEQVREGARRIHKTPEVEHVRSCLPWLVRELALVEPELVVALGATAAKAVIHPEFRVTRQRGIVLEWPRPWHGDGDVGPRVMATVHPSSVLRADDREAAYAALVADLKVAAGQLG